MRQRRQVQPVGLELAALGLSGLCIGQPQLGVAAGPMQAVLRVEGQRLGGKLNAIRQLAPTQAPLQSLQGKGLQISPQHDADLGQGHVRHRLGDAPALPRPPRPATRPLPRRKSTPKLDVTAQFRQVGPLERGIELAVPVLPMALLARQQGLLKTCRAH